MDADGLFLLNFLFQMPEQFRIEEILNRDSQTIAELLDCRNSGAAVPTIPSLEKICTAFGITLSQLFAEEDAPVSLTEAQKKLLERWSRLSEEQQAVVFALIDKM